MHRFISLDSNEMKNNTNKIKIETIKNELVENIQNNQDKEEKDV
jgi:hypothetical protein